MSLLRAIAYNGMVLVVDLLGCTLDVVLWLTELVLVAAAAFFVLAAFAAWRETGVWPYDPVSDYFPAPTDSAGWWFMDWDLLACVLGLYLTLSIVGAVMRQVLKFVGSRFIPAQA